MELAKQMSALVVQRNSSTDSTEGMGSSAFSRLFERPASSCSKKEEELPRVPLVWSRLAGVTSTAVYAAETMKRKLIKLLYISCSKKERH